MFEHLHFIRSVLDSCLLLFFEKLDNLVALLGGAINEALVYRRQTVAILKDLPKVRLQLQDVVGTVGNLILEVKHLLDVMDRHVGVLARQSSVFYEVLFAAGIQRDQEHLNPLIDKQEANRALSKDQAVLDWGIALLLDVDDLKVVEVGFHKLSVFFRVFKLFGLAVGAELK